jgi:hypothetical protein
MTRMGQKRQFWTAGQYYKRANVVKLTSLVNGEKVPSYYDEKRCMPLPEGCLLSDKSVLLVCVNIIKYPTINRLPWFAPPGAARSFSIK